MTEQAVSNSTCLIGLERIGRLDLLQQVFTVLFVPPGVCAEFGKTLSWFTVVPVQNLISLAVLQTQVDAGEAEAIALAMELNDVVLILDDKKARRLAQQMGLKVIGTVGVLLRAKQKGIVTEITPLLDALIQADFRISDPLYKEALRLSGETST